MQVFLTFRHMEPSEPLKTYAREKMERLDKYFPRPVDIKVVLSMERFLHVANVTLQSSGLVVKGEEKSEDMYSSLDRVVAKLEAQVRRHREKALRKKPTPAQHGERERMEVLADHRENPFTPQIVRTNRVVARPMSLDEAIRQLSSYSDPFLVFTDAASHGLSVVYRLDDGNYGLVETAPA